MKTTFDIFTYEEFYHQAFIDFIDEFPDNLKTNSDEKLLVWAHELACPGAGRLKKGEGQGKADILTVDESGFPWLIEAKINSNTELNGNVWSKQIEKYRESLMKKNWYSFESDFMKFLNQNKKERTTKPQLKDFNTAESFQDVIKIWQTSIDRRKLNPSELEKRLISHLQNGTFGIAI